MWGANAIPGLFHYVEEFPADDKCAFDFSRVQFSDYNFTSLQFLIRDDPYWTSMENCLELMELSTVNKVSLVLVSSCNNNGSIRDDPYLTSRNNSLQLIELPSINKVSLV